MEYNQVIRFCAPGEEDPSIAIGADGHAMRDRDHKFEWSRALFQDWCQKQAQLFGYTVSFAGVGECTDHAQWLAQAPEGSVDVGMATQVLPCDWLSFSKVCCGRFCCVTVLASQFH